MSKLRTSVADLRGQALVEFALVLSILILLFIGTFDLGRAVFAHQLLGSGAREGARYATIRPNNTNAIIAATKAKITGLRESDVVVSSSCSPSCAPGGKVTVLVTHTFRPVTPFVSTLALKGVSTMTIE